MIASNLLAFSDAASTAFGAWLVTPIVTKA
jgi:hypothetical protein